MTTGAPDTTENARLPGGGQSLLCQQCQPYDNIWDSDWTGEDDPSLAELLSRAGCPTCQAFGQAVDTYRQGTGALKDIPHSRILVADFGPFFLDTQKVEGGRHAPHRVDLSDPDAIVVRVAVQLDVGLLPDELSSGDADSSDSCENSAGEEDSGDGLNDGSSKDSGDDSDASSSDSTVEWTSITPLYSLRCSRDEPPRLLAIEPWEIPFFDISLLKTWIRGCEKMHGSECNDGAGQTTSSPTPGFRVIDVRSMKVTKPKGPVRFVALSYMWPVGGSADDWQLEKGNLGALETPGALASGRVPGIIADVISLCRDLGEAYLWVDRFCIVQDDAASKHSQIRRMDAIYQSATFTVVAALNSRDGHGLPGFRARPRRASLWRPPRAMDRAGRTSRPNGMGTLVDPSLWNRRGWTFQERVLSRRCLYVTEFQVIWECSRGQASEDVVYGLPPSRQRQEDGKSLGTGSDASITVSEEQTAQEERERSLVLAITKENVSRGYSFDSDISYNLTAASPPPAADYFRWAEQYTSRQLSFGSDILNAFAGVGSALARAHGSRMLSGLLERYLAPALMWSCPGTAERRLDAPPEVPSWSWASAAPRVEYYWILRLGGRGGPPDEIVRHVSLVSFHAPDPASGGGGLRRLAVEERWVDQEGIALEEWFQGRDTVPALACDDAPDVEAASRTWRECPHNPWQAIAHNSLDQAACDLAAARFPNSLVFNTTVATLRVSPAVEVKLFGTYGQSIHRDEQFEDPGWRDVAICGPDGDDAVGCVSRMGHDWIADQGEGGKLHDFVVVCGALCDGRSRRIMARMGSSDMWLLHVLLVERQLPFAPYVVRRVDAGYVFAHKWKDCRPRWETAVLV